MEMEYVHPSNWIDIKPPLEKMTEEKHPEVTFKYYLPQHEGDVYRILHSFDMASALWNIDQKCRNIVKHGDPSEEVAKLCEEIRDMIRQDIDLDRIYS